MTTRLRFIGLGLVLVAAIGMGWPPGVTQPPAFFAANPTITDQQRVAAMLSVHGHARFDPDPDAAAIFMPLSQAVAILHDDTGPAAASRRRRAVAKLAAYNAVAFHGAIVALAGPAITHEVDTFLGSVAPAGLPKEVLEKELMNVVGALAPSECRVKALRLKGQVYPPPPVSWAYDMLVPRTVGDIARAIDPQSWAECSLLFYDSYLIETPSCCPFSETRDCSYTPADAPEPHPGTAEPPGKPYGWVSFFEEFCAKDEGTQCSDECVNGDCDVDFDNILCVKTWYTPTVTSSSQTSSAGRYDVDYNFGRTLRGEFLGTPGYKITADQGGLHVRVPTLQDTNPLPTGTWSFVHVDKSVTFETPETTNEVGNWMMSTAVEDELQGQIIEMACCDIAPQRWGAGILNAAAEYVRQFPKWLVPIWDRFWVWIRSVGG